MTFFEKLLNNQSRPMVMGILNVTPDSFSDGGLYQDLTAARQQIEKMVEAGVDIIDVGGESTRPGAHKVGLQQELDRVLPVVELIRTEFSVAVSLDSYKTEVMRESIALGVDLINDVNALRSPGALEVVADSGVGVCLMHKKGDSQTMQQAPHYKDVVAEVKQFLSERVDVCQKAGIKSDRILLDPGFGFGKNLSHNVKLFHHLQDFVSLGYPVLAGVSRKRMIGELLGGLATEERVVGSVVAALLSTLKGVKLLRVHDVPETVQAIKIAQSLM